MEKILVSACLCGLNVRYDGGHGSFPLLEKLRKYYEIVPFCPEVEGGLSIPRTKAEIVKGQVMTEEGVNVTKNYNLGAEKALSLCHYLGIRIAILNDKSPSCGSRFIHDGSFKNNVIEGLGVTARLLIADGIKVYSDKDALEFLIPEEDENKKERRRTTHQIRHSDANEGRKKTFKKERSVESEAQGERKPFRKKSFRKSDGKKSFGEKKFTGKKSFGKKDFTKKTYSKKRVFKQKDHKE